MNRIVVLSLASSFVLFACSSEEPATTEPAAVIEEADHMSAPSHKKFIDSLKQFLAAPEATVAATPVVALSKFQVLSEFRWYELECELKVQSQLLLF